MRILVLAPHPFYQDRGTPIDVLLVLRVLTQRASTQVDVLTYHEGESVELPNLRLIRIPSPPGIKNVRPGFSVKKLICDFLMFFKAWFLVRQNRYDIIHAGEEAVFFARFFKKWYGIPYAYDLDSSIAQQLVEKKPSLRFLSKNFDRLERNAIQGSLINFPVCNALADLCEANGSPKTVTLHDISQLNHASIDDPGMLKREVDVEGTVFLYIGNLERYQGIDLLLEGFSLAAKKTSDIHLIIVGGVPEDIQSYQEKANRLGIAEQTYFLGPRPFDQLGNLLSGADVLVCPRIKGINTPMKIFPYLHSGKPVLATDLNTHNQILTSNEAYLAAADPEGFSKGILDLANDATLCERLGENGQAFVEKNHTFSAYQERLNNAYDWIEGKLRPSPEAQSV